MRRNGPATPATSTAGRILLIGGILYYGSLFFTWDASNCVDTPIGTICGSVESGFSNIGIVNAAQRELVIDRLLALDARQIDIEQVKWVVLMVLFSQPGQENALLRMEDLVFDGRAEAVH